MIRTPSSPAPATTAYVLFATSCIAMSDIPSDSAYIRAPLAGTAMRWAACGAMAYAEPSPSSAGATRTGSAGLVMSTIRTASP